ncbi:MAG: RNA pseudouridine synthase, partial [Mesorhizobium sp.]
MIGDGLSTGGSPDTGSPGSVVLEAGPDAAGQRLDQWLAGKLGPDMSRSRVQMLIRQGAVKVAGQPVNETKRKLAAGDRVSVDMPEPEPAQPQGENIPLDVLYEDNELIVID